LSGEIEKHSLTLWVKRHQLRTQRWHQGLQLTGYQPKNIKNNRQLEKPNGLMMFAAR
jgi:hypothetical protein